MSVIYETRNEVRVRSYFILSFQAACLQADLVSETAEKWNEVKTRLQRHIIFRWLRVFVRSLRSTSASLRRTMRSELFTDPRFSQSQTHVKGEFAFVLLFTAYHRLPV